jgi:hypothetical protein
MQSVLSKTVVLTAAPHQLVPPGEIHGKACEPSVDCVRVEFPIEYRLGMHGEISDEYKCLSVKEIRGFGRWAEVLVQIDARRSGQIPFQLTLEAGKLVVDGEGKAIIDRPTPYILGMQTICGGSTSSACPIKEELWETRRYHAFFEPKLKEFWLSQSKGIVNAGAKEFPFKVFFAPKDPRPIETLLVVEMEDMEVTVKVCGSIGGFEGRQWGARKH